MKSALAFVLLTSVTLVGLPNVPAMAAEEHAATATETGTAPEAHEPQLIDVDHTVFIQLGIFLLLMVILGKFLWGPYLRVRTQRVERVDGYREEAVKLEADAQQRLQRADAALAEARRVGAGERAVARAEAHNREQTLLAEATAADQRKLAEARTRLTAAVEAERKKLQGDSSDVAMSAARKILGREVGA